jgi:hypothetical protein
MIDPVSIAAVTAAVTVLATKFVEGVLAEAGKSLWKRVAPVLGLAESPKPEDLPDMPEKVAQALVERPDALAEVQRILAENPAATGVNITINAKNVGAGYVAGNQYNKND